MAYSYQDPEMAIQQGRVLSPRLAALRRLAIRARMAHSQAMTCDYKTLDAAFHGYFVKFKKVKLIFHLLGLFPRKVIK